MSQRVAIGNDLYLIHGDEGPSDFLLISAHGATKNDTFSVPGWTRLHFYAPRKHYLIMPMSKFQLGSRVVEEINPGGSSPNYALSKYQGRHGDNNETYATLGALVDRTRKSIEAGRPQMPAIPASAGPGIKRWVNESFKEKIKEYENLLPFDFLTIRNRKPYLPFAGGTSLKAALAQLDQSGYRYPYIFCSFCRGVLFGNKGSHEVESY